VLHTYGPGIDQPLSTIRLAFAPWQQFAAIPVWDAQGRVPYILFSDGTRRGLPRENRVVERDSPLLPMK
jgi:hypothetical protein